MDQILQLMPTYDQSELNINLKWTDISGEECHASDGLRACWFCFCRRLSLARYLPDESGGRSANVYNPDVNNFTDPKSGKGQKSRENKTRQRKKGEIVKPATLSDDEIQFLRRRQVRKPRTLQFVICFVSVNYPSHMLVCRSLCNAFRSFLIWYDIQSPTICGFLHFIMSLTWRTYQE